MLRSEFFCLVVIFFILVNTDLSEAKRGGGYKGYRSRPSGGGYKGYRSSSGGGGGGGGDWKELLITLAGIAGFIFLFFCIFCYCCGGYDDCRELYNLRKNAKERPAMEPNRQNLRNNSSNTVIDM